MQLKAIIFDMGNTLLRYSRPEQQTWRQTEEISFAAVYSMLEQHGLRPAVSVAAFADLCFEQLAAGWANAVAGRANLRIGSLLVVCCRELGIALPDNLVPKLERAYAAPLRSQLEGATGAVETLEALRKRNYRIGLISNTVWPGNLHRIDLQSLGLLPLIDHTLFSGDEGVWKPNRTLFERALAALGALPHEAIFVGDSPTEDIVGAQQAGMRAVWMHTVEFPLDDVQPDAHIRALPELLGVIGSWTGDARVKGQ